MAIKKIEWVDDILYIQLGRRVMWMGEGYKSYMNRMYV